MAMYPRTQPSMSFPHGSTVYPEGVNFTVCSKISAADVLRLSHARGDLKSYSEMHETLGRLYVTIKTVIFLLMRFSLSKCIDLHRPGAMYVRRLTIMTADRFGRSREGMCAHGGAQWVYRAAA